MKKHGIVLLTGAVLSTALVGAAWAGGEDRLGTVGALELRIPVGARSTAMGGATVATAVGAEALYWNPAGLVGDQSTNVLLTHTEYLNDMNVEYAGLASPAMGGQLGASFKALSIGDIIVTTEDAPDGTGDVSSPTFSVAQLAYGRQMTDRVAFGGSVALVNEHIMQENATGISFDFGFQFDPKWQGLRFGFAMKNFGPNMRFSGSDFEHSVVVPGGDPNAKPTIVQSESAPFELPSTVLFGAAKGWDVGARSKFQLAGAFQHNNFSEDEYRVGAEITFIDAIAIRGGYVYSPQDDYLYDFTAGAGLGVALGEAHAMIDYTFTNVKNWFDPTHAFSVRVGF